MILSTWVANTLEELRNACVVLLNENDVDIVDIALEETDDRNTRTLRVIVMRNNQQEGDDETAGKSYKKLGSERIDP